MPPKGKKIEEDKEVKPKAKAKAKGKKEDGPEDSQAELTEEDLAKMSSDGDSAVCSWGEE